jgi:GT2 family glycosyltransferase
MNHAYALCVVSYYPEEHLKDRLLMAVEQGYDVYVYDNTPGGCGWAAGKGLSSVKWLGNGQNVGMGMGLNQLMSTVLEEGFNGAFYVDQDTDFTENTLSWIDHFLDRYPESLFRWGALNFLNSGNFRECIEEVNLMVSAGTLFNLRAMSVIGLHNTQWFLECVDYEWCGRALKAGYPLGVVRGCVGLDHEKYQPATEVKWMGQTRQYRLYPLKRSIQFVWGLFRLGTWGMIRGLKSYAWSCYRNICTHLFDQTGAVFLSLLKWGRVLS